MQVSIVSVYPRAISSNKPRIRRIRCGEEKPHCMKCISSGRHCEWYETIRIATPSTDAAGEIVLRWVEPPSQQPAASCREREALCFFREGLLGCSCSTWDMSVWRRLVLPMSVNEPIIRHAVVALSALSRPGEGNAALGLKQYNLAMKGLQNAISTDDQRTQNLILVTCLLFVAIEFVQHGWKQAQSHLSGGLSIIEETQRRTTHTRSSDTGELAPLEQIFGRLDNQMSLFTSSRVQLHRAMSNGRMAFLPAELRLKSIEDASDLHGLQLGAMREVVFEIESQRFAPAGITTSNYMELEVQLGRQLASLSRWHAAIQDFLPTLTKLRDQRLGKLLMMSHLCCKMMVSNALADGRETCHDDFIPEFEEILRLGSEWLYSDTERAYAGQRRFSLDMGIIAPVYYVALKCRDPQLRRSAIALLKSSNSQEGAWDSGTMALLAERIVKVEETGLCSPQSAADVPEQNRLWRAWFDLRMDSDVLHCMRRAWEQGGEWIEYEVKVG